MTLWSRAWRRFASSTAGGHRLCVRPFQGVGVHSVCPQRSPLVSSRRYSRRSPPGMSAHRIGRYPPLRTQCVRSYPSVGTCCAPTHGTDGLRFAAHLPCRPVPQLPCSHAPSHHSQFDVIRSNMCTSLHLPNNHDSKMKPQILFVTRMQSPGLVPRIRNEAGGLSVCELSSV